MPSLYCNAQSTPVQLQNNKSTPRYYCLLIMYRGIHSKATKYIIYLLKADEPKRDNMRSNETGLKLKVPLIRYNTFATRSFSYTAATLWNALPTNIPQCKPLDKFKGSLKTHLYRKAFNLQALLTSLYKVHVPMLQTRFSM